MIFKTPTNQRPNVISVTIARYQWEQLVVIGFSLNASRMSAPEAAPIFHLKLHFSWL